MDTKIFVNEKGQAVVKLPVDGRSVTLRSPKGKDLKAIETASATATSNIDVMFGIICTLAVNPAITSEDLDELDVEDIEALGEALATFRVFRKQAQ